MRRHTIAQLFYSEKVFLTVSPITKTPPTTTTLMMKNPSMRSLHPYNSGRNVFARNLLERGQKWISSSFKIKNSELQQQQKKGSNGTKSSALVQECFVWVGWTVFWSVPISRRPANFRHQHGRIPVGPCYT